MTGDTADRRVDVDVAHVGCERHHVRPAPASARRAAFQRTHSERVPQIVQPRTASRPRPDASLPDQPVEGLLDGNVAKRPTALVDEHRIIV